jgi:CSLREA domain-containing protein
MATRKKSVYSLGGLLLLSLMFLFLAPGESHAAVYTVNSTADTAGLACVSGVGTCTLRSAIQLTNVLGGGGTIILPAGTYTLTIPPVAGDTTALNGDLDFNGLGGPVTITGAGAATTIIDGGAIDRVFDLVSPANITISGVTIRNGNPGAAAGGGAFNTGGGTTLTLNHAIIANNTAPAEGGAFAIGAGGSTVTLNDVAITNNTSPGSAVNVGLGSTFTLTIGTISGNSDSAINNGGTTNLTNVTMVGNITAGNGGAISNKATGTVNLTNVTISGNTAPAVNVGGIINLAGIVNLKNTIVANSLGSNCGGAMTLLGGNLSTDATCGLPVTLPANLGLELSLIDNGGTQLTLSLLPGSPAIDAGVAGCPATDERGIARPVDGNIPLDGVAICDIGAFEFRPQKIAVAPASPVNFGTVPDGTVSDQTITISNLGDGNLTITDLALIDPLALPFSRIVATDTCTGATLPHPPSSCTVTVRFAPTAAAAASDTFNITSNDPATPLVTFALSGVGSLTPVPVMSVTDSIAPGTDNLMPFGGVVIGQTSDATVTVTNTGTANLIIGAIAAIASPFSITSDTCSGQTVAASATCSLTVHFAPTANSQANASLSIPSNITGTPPVTISLSGSGVSTTGNNPPSQPVLVTPAPGQTDVPTTMTFVWNKAVDPDGDVVTYHFNNCTNQTMTTGCTNADVTAAAPSGLFFAGLGSFGAGIILIGFVAGSGLKRSRMTMFLITFLLLSGTLFMSCHKSSSEETTLPPPAEQISNVVRNLTPSTTYYWKVVADDGKGGLSSSAVSSYTTAQ